MFFRKVWPFIKSFKRSFILSFLFSMLYAAFGTLSFMSMAPFINVLFGDATYKMSPPIFEDTGSVKEYAEEYLNYFITHHTALHGKSYVLIIFIFFIITLFLLKNLSGYTSSFFSTLIKHGVEKKVRQQLYQKIISLPYSKAQQLNKGDLITRMSSDVNELNHAIGSIVSITIRDPFTVLFTIWAMFWVSTELTLFVMFFVPISGLMISFIGRKLKKGSVRVQEEMGRFLSIFDETINGVKIIKSFNAQDLFIDKFTNSLERSRKLSNKLVNRQNVAGPMSEFLGVSMIGILLWYGGRMVLVDKSITGSLFITYIGLAYNILTPVKSISKAAFSIRKGTASLDRILKILNIDTADYHVATTVTQTATKFNDQFKNDITFAEVAFAYDKQPVIKGLSLTINKGDSIALVGSSGGGKSTITNLLNRFYDHYTGQILIDGVDIKTLSHKELRSMIGLVTQDQILFHDTVRANLLIGNPNATEDEITDALAHANALDFVMDNPAGLDAIIEPNGGNFSGGQKQRLCLARALVKNPPILILDEATSALDAASEKLVQEALQKIMKSRTSITIAHRLSTIQSADKIVVIGDGKILEMGSHEELIQKDTYYSGLVKLQSN